MLQQQLRIAHSFAFGRGKVADYQYFFSVVLVTDSARVSLALVFFSVVFTHVVLPSGWEGRAPGRGAHASCILPTGRSRR